MRGGESEKLNGNKARLKNKKLPQPRHSLTNTQVNFLPTSWGCVGRVRDSGTKNRKITKPVSFNCFIFFLEITFTKESNVTEEDQVFILFFDTISKKVTCLTYFSYTSRWIFIWSSADFFC